MDELRTNAALAEMNAMIQGLIQRCIDLSCDLAVAQSEIKQLKEKQNETE
jgi:hypothetical protein